MFSNQASFCIQFENLSKVSWGELQISMGFVQPPRSAPIFASPHESLVTQLMESIDRSGSPFLDGMTGIPFVCGESPQGAQLPVNPKATCKVHIVMCGL